MNRPVRTRLASALAGLVATSALLSGCSIVGIGTSDDPGSSKTSAVPSATPTPYDSQFTRDGTFQSHIEVNGLDFVYTLYPTKSTPRTNEWYPRGNKFFSFTFQAYDLNRAIRDRFATKRKVYLSDIEVTSRTKTTGGGRTQHPYNLKAVAKEITFDPEPVTTRYGMIITSPKGAFELRNQKIGPTSLDTRGIDLLFTATVHIQTSPGSAKFYERKIRQTVPIAIFSSKKKTDVAQIPVDAN
ncbi:hypothetical protein H5V45_16660 [Nocardioides sp. KIGAM211]|uniref:Uncharacterized protein n=1 Tax=Nocardioides luti TaxID=2761101 RepID=A0A7X0RIH7_9ACTN|nr:hypothetical protein [Nocardioides luti]MBB6628959.1 hypothetical protein [Nocardioides luti]